MDDGQFFGLDDELSVINSLLSIKSTTFGAINLNFQNHSLFHERISTYNHQ